MKGTTYTLLAISILGLACATALLPAGCESSNKVAATGTSAVCPLCKTETRVQPLTGLKYTTCVCPTCGRVVNLSPQLRNDLERFLGGPVDEEIAVCDYCRTAVAQCAACRQKQGS
jgi:hypothetical protein